METNEIMTNEEYEIEEVYDFDGFEEEESSGKGLKAVVGVGLAAGLGYLGYKFVVKPLVNKFKAKKGQSTEKDVVIVDHKVEYEVCDEDVPESTKGKK